MTAGTSPKATTRPCLVVADNAEMVAAMLPRDSMVSFLMLPRRAFSDLPEKYCRLRDPLPYRMLRLASPTVR